MNRKYLSLLLLVLPVAIAVAIPPGWLKRPAFPGLEMKFSSLGCIATGGTVGKTAITFSRTGAASYANGSSLASCAADNLRGDPSGARVEPARTNSYPFSATSPTLTAYGTASAVLDGTLAPNGAGHAFKLSGLGSTSNAVSRSVTGLTASAAVGAAVWVKRISTSGVLRFDNGSGSGGTGQIDVDLSLLPDAWVRIGDHAVSGVTYTTAWKVSSAGGVLPRFYAASGSPSVYVASIQVEEGHGATTPITSYAQTTANTFPDSYNLTAWTKVGTATAIRDGTLGPDGATQATLVGGIQTAALGRLLKTTSGAAASSPDPTSLWIKRVSTSGVVTFAAGNGRGGITADLAQLPDDWVQIGAAPVTGVSLTNEWETDASGNAGLSITATGGPVSFYLAGVVQSVYTGTARGAETLAVANPLKDADTAWCVQAGAGWALGSGANSASMAYVGTDLVFTVTDKDSGTKTVTQPAATISSPGHEIVACNAAGTLSLYIDGMALGTAAGAGTGIITTQPATLTVTDSCGPLPKLALARSSEPTKVSLNMIGPSLIVAFTFDDGLDDQYNNGLPVFDDHGMHATLFVPPDASYNFGADKVASAIARGHEIGSHSLSHTNVAKTTNWLRREWCDSRARLAALGATDVRTLGWPFGAFDASTEAAAAFCGYSSGRTTVPKAIGYTQVPNALPFEVGDVGYTDVATMETAITNAEANLPTTNGKPGVFVFSSHHIAANPGQFSTGGIDPADLSTLLDWLALRAPRTVVRTFGEATGAVATPIVPSGTPLVIEGDMETYLAGTTAAPTCWERSATGATGTWSRVTGRGGTGYAQQVVASAWTTGPVVLREDNAAGTACSIPATTGKTYTITCYYQSDVAVRLIGRTFRTSDNSFQPWAQSDTFPASPSTWAAATWTTPAFPASRYAISAGIGIVDGVCPSGCLGANGTATMVVDDCSAVEN